VRDYGDCGGRARDNKNKGERGKRKNGERKKITKTNKAFFVFSSLTLLTL
jgi:hypothetical protein